MRNVIKAVLWVVAFIFVSLLCLVAYLSFLSIGCDSGELPKLTEKYYSAEGRGDWKVTYLMRTPEFKNEHNMEDYIFTMSQDSKGWELIDFEVGDVRSLFSYAQVDIRTVESVPSEHFLHKQYDFENNMGFRGASKWRCVDKSWYIVDPLFRYHFTLNLPRR